MLHVCDSLKRTNSLESFFGESDYTSCTVSFDSESFVRKRIELVVLHVCDSLKRTCLLESFVHESDWLAACVWFTTNNGSLDSFRHKLDYTGCAVTCVFESLNKTNSLETLVIKPDYTGCADSF